jgi:hypothetical protein
MSNGVVNPVIPLAADIMMGVFKTYLNYGLPSQTLLGATDGGCKLDIEPDVKEIKCDGVYGYQLDTNGIPLVRSNKLLIKLTLEQLYLKYFNSKSISTCESDGTWESQDWAAGGGTYAAETTIVLEGNQSAKCTASTDQHGIHEVFASAKNLTAFDNSEVSDTADYIGFAIYIASQDKTDLGSAKIRIGIHKDIEGTETNLYYYDVAAADLTANCWTTFKVAKSAFSQTGTASWSTVTGISFQLQGSPNAEVIFYVDSIQLLQAQTNSSIVLKNASTFDYTDETTYRKWTPSLEILDSDFIQNVTLVGQKHNGKMVKHVLENCFSDNSIMLALEEKKEVINSTTFVAHYDTDSGTTPPYAMYEYQ